MDKTLELEVLRAAIGALANDVKPGESPDFLAEWCGKVYGFEVTEFFPNQTAAKMRKKPEYGVALIQGSTHIHSRDVGELTVDDVQWYKNGGSKPISLRAVIQQLPPKTKLIELLQEKIAAKGEKAPRYLQRCDAVDLIIRDKGGYFVENDPPKHISTLFQYLDLNAIRRSPFREIALVTTIWGGDENAIVPLKAVTLLSDSHAVKHLLNERSAGLSDIEIVKAYMASIAMIGHGSEFAIERDGNLVLTCGGHEMVLAEDGLFVIPQDVHRPPEDKTSLTDVLADCDEAVLRLAAEIAGLRKTVFACVPLHIPAGSDDALRETLGK